MTTTNFIHLHTHSEFSLLDGASRIKDLVKKAVDYNMPAIALTDHGVMYGNISFYSEAKSAGIKPILGCEVYVAPRHRTLRDPKQDKEHHHLVLLAKNEQGYKNLIKLVSIAYSEGFYYKPRVDKELLATYSDNLVAMSACLGGEIPYWIMQNDNASAEKSLGEYVDIFGKENFYLELQDHFIREQKLVNEVLVSMAKKTGVKLVATNDIHYTTRENSEAHDVLLCIQTQSTLDDPKRLKFDGSEFYFKNQEEMAKLFPEIPEALENTYEIMEQCNIEFQHGKSKLPDPGVPEFTTPDKHMETEAANGLRQRLNVDELPEDYRKQLEYECKIINDCGFALYMLIVRDFTDFAREKGIYIGVRGSAAGSIVCYGLKITDVDPIDYGLTFERFLNPERIEMPDVDLDIQDDRREDLIQYVIDKYGKDRVGQIATFGSMKARGAVRDCGRVLGMELSLVDKVCKMIPNMPIGIKIEDALKDNSDLQDIYNRDISVRKLIDTAKTLEGINRNVGVHAAGVLISEDPLTDHVPVHQGGKGETVAQLAKKDIAKVGLLKMDFLGLANLTILAEAVKNVKRFRGIDIDIMNIPLDDKKTFEMLGQGDTNGVFQLESAGMRRNVVELKPNSVRELAAIVALFRPGPMAYIPNFIKSKFGQKTIKYLHPSLESILEETYGVICYQDQVLRIAQAIAGFSLGQADILRKAMSSKDQATMEKQKEKFIDGAVNNGIRQQIAAKIYEQVEPFAGYAFNKAHAVCYAFLSYRTAYMKANYSVEYFAALMSANIDDKNKLAMYMEDCRRWGIEILPPDVDNSFVRFEVEDDKIRFGLSAIKNCSNAAIDGLVEARNKGGKFSDIMDFCERVQENMTINKSTLESLIKVGAFANIWSNRAQLLEMLPDVINSAACKKRDALSGQNGLFDDVEDNSACSMDMSRYNHICEMNKGEILNNEKELTGVYLSGHPLEEYRSILEKTCNTNSRNFTELEKDKECQIGGIITDITYKTTKRGDKMAIVKLEDISGSIPVTFFVNALKVCDKYLEKDKIVVIKGKANHRERINTSDEEDAVTEVEIRGESVTPVKMLNNKSNGYRAMHVKINGKPNINLDLLKNLLDANPGTGPVYFHLVHDGEYKKIATSFRVDANPRLISEIERFLGKDSVKIG